VAALAIAGADVGHPGRASNGGAAATRKPAAFATE